MEIRITGRPRKLASARRANRFLCSVVTNCIPVAVWPIPRILSGSLPPCALVIWGHYEIDRESRRCGMGACFRNGIKLTLHGEETKRCHVHIESALMDWSEPSSSNYVPLLFAQFRMARRLRERRRKGIVRVLSNRVDGMDCHQWAKLCTSWIISTQGAMCQEVPNCLDGLPQMSRRTQRTSWWIFRP